MHILLVIYIYLQVLSLIPEESVSGLEGAVDTDLHELSLVPYKSGMSKHNRYTNAQCNGHFVNKSLI